VAARRTLTARRLNRATLERQLLLRRARLDVVDAIRRVVAVQAQEAASPYLALWNRLAPFEPGDLDAAFADRSIVKASLVRMTLHAVDARDYPAFHDAMQPSLRASRLLDPRFQVAGLSIPEADELIPAVLAFLSTARTNAEVEAWLDERLGVLPRPGIWWALRTFAPVVHAPTGAPWSFGPRPAYVAAPSRRPADDPDVALRILARRYLQGFGPASVADLARFSLVPRSRARAQLEDLARAGELEVLRGPDEAVVFDVPGGRRPPEDAAAPPRLLGMWDSVLLAYADGRRIVPAEYRSVVTRQNGDVLPTLLVDGFVAGVWRAVDGRIEATAFRRLPDDAWEALDSEARSLRALLAGRDPNVYRRYGHWWRKGLPAAETRLIGA
jgi:hypothetical protein